MALCTFAITVGHDLKPHRGKGRPIETAKRKSDYEYPYTGCWCFLLNEQKQLKSPPNGCDIVNWAPPMKGLRNGWGAHASELEVQDLARPL